MAKITFVPYDEEMLHRAVDALDAVARERGKTIPQVALNWLLRKPTVANIVVGARNEEQLRQNLGALGWRLTDEEVARIDKAGERPPVYPYWHQRNSPKLIPPLPAVAQ